MQELDPNYCYFLVGFYNISIIDVRNETYRVIQKDGLNFGNTDVRNSVYLFEPLCIKAGKVQF
jgi:hypothetical protein